MSTDGGQTWAEAEFLDPVQRHAWRRWKFRWLYTEEAGTIQLAGPCAKDAKGGVQPDKHDQNHGDPECFARAGETTLDSWLEDPFPDYDTEPVTGRGATRNPKSV